MRIRIPLWLCWPCLFTGLGLALLSTSAYASASAAGESPGWPWIANGALGVMIMLVAAYVKGAEARITRSEASIATCASNTTALRELVLTRYLEDTEIERLLQPINLQMTDVNKRQRHQEILLLAIHNRLDQAGIGVRTRMPGPDDGN